MRDELSIPAAGIARPVLHRLTRGAVRGRVLGWGRNAAYVDLGGFVAVLTGPGVPALPNGIALARWPGSVRRPAADEPVALGPGLLRVLGVGVRWDVSAPPAWDPTVPVACRPRVALARRGASILRACGLDDDPSPGALAATLAAAVPGAAASAQGAEGIAALVDAIATADRSAARRAARLLVGRGPGLTPEGDDLLAGAAVTLAATGGRAALLPSDLVPPALASSTTALSATLIELAGRGQAPEPVHALLDLADPAAWRTALPRLLRLGHSTGRVYAVGVAVTAVLLADTSVPATRRHHRTSAPG